MKISFEREKLLAAFQIAASVAPARSPKPILQNVKLEIAGDVTTLMATDLEVGIRIAVPGVTVETPGSAVLPIARFGPILRECTDEKLYLESDAQGNLVRGERSEWKLPGENPDEFPNVTSFKEEKFHELAARLFREIVRRTVFATDNESSRYALGGVLLEMEGDKIIAVGTDGRRLAKMEGPGHAVGGHQTANQTTIVPTRAMNLLERAITDGDGEVQIAARANDILVRSPRFTIYSRLVEGRFPKWRDVFPRRTDVVKTEIAVGPVYAAVRQAAIATSEESRGIDFTFDNGLLVLAGRAADVGQSRVELPIAYSGPKITITLDPRFVSDFLRVLDPEKTFTLELKDSDSAAVCNTDDGYGYVIMPLARDR
ncbi:MAG TPA: DNA polymerase III subunit beta [Pirellulales bacterium]|jgi:DNA polymerase-3 subunit beta